MDNLKQVAAEVQPTQAWETPELKVGAVTQETLAGAGGFTDGGGSPS